MGGGGAIANATVSAGGVLHVEGAAVFNRLSGGVEFVDVPDDDATQAMIQSGLPGFVAEQLVNVFAMLRLGVAEQVTATVESLTGRPPRDFAAFASDHARPFVPVTEGAGR